MMKDGTVCRVFPDKRGEYKVTAPPRMFHKSRMPKIMFLAVCARPGLEYNFDGKIGLWSFTLERPAKRSDVRTGTVVRQTMILEDVSVTAPEYRMKIVGKDGVFDSMRRSMWWFHKSARYEVSGGVRVPCGKHAQGKWQFSKRKGTRCPEAGQPLHYQHDGARPHTAQVNQRVFASHGKMKDFNIQVVVQPAQSPDLNVDDLAFFHSLQSDVSLEPRRTDASCWRRWRTAGKNTLRKKCHQCGSASTPRSMACSKAGVTMITPVTEVFDQRTMPECRRFPGEWSGKHRSS